MRPLLPPSRNEMLQIPPDRPAFSESIIESEDLPGYAGSAFLVEVLRRLPGLVESSTSAIGGCSLRQKSKRLPHTA